MRFQLKLRDSKRKLTGPNTLPAVLRTKGPRGASQLWTSPAPLEAGGSGEGKGAGSAPRTAAPTTLQTGLQFLTKDFLRFWMVNIAGSVAAKHKAQAPDWRAWKLRLGPRRGEGSPHPGRGSPSSSWLPELLGPGKAQNAGATESALLWRTRKLELHSTQGPLHIEQPGA